MRDELRSWTRDGGSRGFALRGPRSCRQELAENHRGRRRSQAEAPASGLRTPVHRMPGRFRRPGNDPRYRPGGGCLGARTLSGLGTPWSESIENTDHPADDGLFEARLYRLDLGRK